MDNLHFFLWRFVPEILLVGVGADYTPLWMIDDQIWLSNEKEKVILGNENNKTIVHMPCQKLTLYTDNQF